MNYFRILIVGGNFDGNGGKASRIAEQLRDSLGCDMINGGTIQDLKKISFKDMPYDVLIWMPNVSNDEDKIIGQIKSQNQKLILVSSKRLDDRDFTLNDCVGRALQTKSNLVIAISRFDRFCFSLIDPLGNRFFTGTSVHRLGTALEHRLIQLLSMTRMPTERLPEDQFDWSHQPVGFSHFIYYVNKLGHEFNKYAAAINPNRLLGNASTRCSYGFPSARICNNEAYVSRRNIEKSDISHSGFVRCHLSGNRVHYRGDHKPSVDTPVQLKLYEHFPNINFMIHGHVYVHGGVYTKNVIPCGALNEVEEIINLVPKDATSFLVNLKGHGCLIGVCDPANFELVRFKARPFPEDH